MFAFPMKPVEKELSEDERRERIEEFLSRVSIGMSVKKREEFYAEVEKQIKEGEELSKNNDTEEPPIEEIKKMMEEFEKNN